MSDITEVLPAMEDVRLEKRREVAVALLDHANSATLISNYLEYKQTVELMKNAERKLETRYERATFEPAYFTA